MTQNPEYLKRRFETFFVFVVIFFAGLINYLVPYKMAFLNLYAIPVLMAAYYLDIRKTLTGAVACILLTCLNVRLAPQHFLMSPDRTALYISLFTWACFLLLSAILVDTLKRRLLAEVERGNSLDRQIVELIREEKRKMEIVFEKITECAILTDTAGEISLLNNSARLYFEHDKQRFTNIKPAFQLFSIKPDLETIMQNVEAVSRFEIFREEPGKLYLEGAAIKLFTEDKAGAIRQEGWLWVLSDVTAQRLEGRMVRNFLSLISHKLKTPLSSITGYAQILESETQANLQPDKIKKFSTHILAQGLKLNTLVESLLDFVMIEDMDNTTLNKTSFDALELINETAGMVRHNFKDLAGLTFKTSAAEKLLMRADRNLIKCALKCLIENAVKFNPAGEKLVTISAEAGDGCTRLSVEDNGPGIPGEELKNIFNKFYQVESSFTGQVEGWGLGLSHVKKTAEIHQGRVLVTSQLQKGSVFTLLIPL
jgi:signal transduction histidine kinase